MDFDALLKLMVHKSGSDLFITAGIPPSIKIHGKITQVTKATLTPTQSQQICFDLMDEKQRRVFDETHECNFAIHRPNIGRFRVNVFQQRNYVGMVARRIETEIPSFEQLKLPPAIEELTMFKRGIILCVGGTGSGKSTSLAAMIDHRNRNSSGHIITIEDPIEYVHEHRGCIVTQREVGIDTDSLDDALINALRQAPDVILIGEIRHRETMEHAIAFAETGHLCLATLHANNANQAMDRIINFFPEERRVQLLVDLSLNLRAVIAQRLIPCVDGQGRRSAVELLINSPLMSDFIHKGDIHEMKELMKKSTELGMQTFDQAVYALFKEGAISMEDALRNADSPNEVRLAAKLDTVSTEDSQLAAMSGISLEETEDDRTGNTGRIR